MGERRTGSGTSGSGGRKNLLSTKSSNFREMMSSPFLTVNQYYTERIESYWLLRNWNNLAQRIGNHDV